MSYHFNRRGTAIVGCLLVFVLCFANVGFAQTQTFNSGSNGSDGALNLTTPGTVLFDPKSFSPPLNPAGDNVYNFTTINIAAGVTVKLSSKVLIGPVYWLAQGAVTINGTIDLNGEDGAPNTTLASTRIPAAGGAGGYSGGIGGSLVPGQPQPQPGNGPGGGSAPTGTNVNANGGNGTYTGSQFLVPLIGGSGGAGGSWVAANSFGGGGSGGGGAILIASSVSITYGGSILANGGQPGAPGSGVGGGAGSGGAIRLVAPLISDLPQSGNGGCGNGHGLLQATGYGSEPLGANGVIRLEAFDLTRVSLGCVGSGVSGVSGTAILTSIPVNVTVPTTAASVLKVTSVNGIAINANPFSFPDAVINSGGPVIVNVQAQNIPVGVIPTIIITSEFGGTQTVSCSALQGTLQQSTCSASVTFPTGGSRGFVKATWTQ